MTFLRRLRIWLAITLVLDRVFIVTANGEVQGVFDDVTDAAKKRDDLKAEGYQSPEYRSFLVEYCNHKRFKLTTAQRLDLHSERLNTISSRQTAHFKRHESQIEELRDRLG